MAGGDMAGGMRQWLRRWRIYLALAPLTLALWLCVPVYEVAVGENSWPSSPDDVPKGAVARYHGLSIQLTGMTVEKPRPRATSDAADAPQETVFVEARFRARVDDPQRAEALLCDSTVQNSAGWEWPRVQGSFDNIPVEVSNSCRGTTVDVVNGEIELVEPEPHTWYEFAYGYVVPTKRAAGLRPTISHRAEYPRYLRFER